MWVQNPWKPPWKSRCSSFHGPKVHGSLFISEGTHKEGQVPIGPPESGTPDELDSGPQAYDGVPGCICSFSLDRRTFLTQQPQNTDADWTGFCWVYRSDD